MDEIDRRRRNGWTPKGSRINIFKKIICLLQDHVWELTTDERGFFGEISRHCIFTCKRCGEQREFHRWAFGYMSGAMLWFFDKEWPITWLSDYAERYAEADRKAKPVWTKTGGWNTDHPDCEDLRRKFRDW